MVALPSDWALKIGCEDDGFLRAREDTLCGPLDYDNGWQGGVIGVDLNKKQSHNANERERRKRLNTAFSNLRFLLPDSSISKRKWSIPTTVSKAVDYIPELQREVDDLLKRREKLHASVSTHHERTHPLTSCLPTVTVIRVDQLEITTQICLSKAYSLPFSTLVARLEGEGLHVTSGSTSAICGNRVCYNLHLQVLLATKFGSLFFSPNQHREPAMAEVLIWLGRSADLGPGSRPIFGASESLQESGLDMGLG
ncbi:hypothetical protein AMTR_s00002p00041060 [Amborella trichopoda]|uniref:BHLH domain-containing protein n=1 Tax=Amborella trichopoda TaxID=13333 RepID=W1NZY2_AMBTC|nr:hypothetical protein AMTR_s00002p00041060 [Amborella trichopoda]